jgi:hypothetical protein
LFRNIQSLYLLPPPDDVVLSDFGSLVSLTVEWAPLFTSLSIEEIGARTVSLLDQIFNLSALRTLEIDGIQDDQMMAHHISGLLSVFKARSSPIVHLKLGNYSAESLLIASCILRRIGSLRSFYIDLSPREFDQRECEEFSRSLAIHDSTLEKLRIYLAGASTLSPSMPVFNFVSFSALKSLKIADGFLANKPSYRFEKSLPLGLKHLTVVYGFRELGPPQEELIDVHKDFFLKLDSVLRSVDTKLSTLKRLTWWDISEWQTDPESELNQGYLARIREFVRLFQDRDISLRLISEMGTITNPLDDEVPFPNDEDYTEDGG